MSPFHHLKRQRQRMAAAVRMGERYGAHTLAGHYGVKLHGYAAMCREGDAGWLAGMLGANGIGPALDDVCALVRWARRHPQVAPVAVHFERRAA